MALYSRSVLLMVTLGLLSPAALGLGLGEVSVQSYLNEPLRAEVALLDVQRFNTDDIRVRLANQEEFDRMGSERNYFLMGIQFDVRVENGTGKVLLSTEQPLLEPYLDLVIEARWPTGRLLREYTLLIDLPPAIKPTPVQVSSKASEAVAALPETVDAPPPAVAAKPMQPARVATRQYDSDTEATPEAGGRYLVQKEDTLWRIAAAARPEGATVEETMFAILEMNGDAFNGRNINGLRAGYVLELPTSREIMLSVGEAVKAARQHNADWESGVAYTPAVRVVADEELPEETASAAMAGDSAQDEESTDAAPVDADSNLLLDSGLNDTPSDTASIVDERQEQLAAIRSRVEILADQVVELESTLVVKDQEIAALQSRLQAQAAAASTQQGEAAPNSALIYWVYALIAANLLTAIAFSWYRRRVTARDEMALNAAGVSDLDEMTARGASADPDNASGNASTADEKASSAAEDALSEAEIYMAYERYQQALNVLQQGLSQSPDNGALCLKVLQVHVLMEQRQAAEDMLVQLRRIGDTQLISEAETLLADKPLQAATSEEAPALSSSPAYDSDAVIANAPMGAELSTPESDLVDAGGSAWQPTATEIGSDLSLEPAGDSAAPSNDTIDDISWEPVAESTPPAADDSSDAMTLPNWGSMSESVVSPDDVSASQLASDEALPGLDLELELAEPEASSPDSDHNDLMFASDSDPMETKLDLARAYIDMGDEEGARPVLQEVADGGTLQQQAEARQLLTRLS